MSSEPADHPDLIQPGRRETTPDGRRVTGYRCRKCGRHDAIYKHVMPYRARHILEILVFDWLGLLTATSDRHAWLSCAHCGHCFRRRTSLAAWWVAWPVALVGIALLVFVITRESDAMYEATALTDFMRRLASVIEAHPTASGFAAIWIVGFTSMTLAVLSIRVRAARKRLNRWHEPRQPWTAEEFDAPSAGQL